MAAINAALSVDLTGQVRCRRGGRQVGGPREQLRHAVNAYDALLVADSPVRAAA